MSLLEISKNTALNTRFSINDPLLNNNKQRKNSNINSTIQQIFKKTRVNLLLSGEEKLMNYIKEDINSNLINVKKPSLLYNYLITIPNFRQYIKINNFESQTIINSFLSARYVKLKKNFKLFNQGDKTDFFYLVLSGCIGFLYNSNSLRSNKPREVNSIKAGTYFGEWGFIFKIPRTVSAYAKEDTLLLKFDKECFKSYYQDKIINSENVRKKFVLTHINTLKKLGISSFNQYYREIKKIYLLQGTTIFESGEKANCFYLIYMGNCCIKNGLNILVIKDAGDFIGVESLYQDEYETSIYTYSEETVLLKFTINTFTNDILDNLRKEFMKYYENQKKLLELWEKNHEKYKNKYKMNFFNSIQNMKSNKIKNNKILNELSLEELETKNNKEIRQKIKPKYISPTNFKINFNSSNINKNKSESIGMLTPKMDLKLKSPKDTKKSYIINKLSEIQNQNIKINLDRSNINKSKYLLTKRFFSLKNKNQLKKKQKLNYSSFVEEEKEILPAYKKINMDNHFSSQNFKLRTKKINSALIRYQLKNNCNKKKKQQINLNKNYISTEKIEKIMKQLSDDFFKIEKKPKQKNKNNSYFKENNKISNDDINVNNNIPLMIIRNYSFINGSQNKFFQ